MPINWDTFSGTDLDIVQQARFRTLQDRMAFWRTWTDTSMEAEFMSAETVSIDLLFLEKDGGNANTMPVAARAEAKFKDDFAASKEFDVGHIAWKCDQGGENSFRLYAKQIRKAGRRGPARVQAGINKLQNNALLARDDNFVAYLGGLSAYTTSAPKAGDLSTRDGQAAGPNNNAGKIFSTSIASDSGKNALVLDGSVGANFLDTFLGTLESLQTRLIRRFQIGGETIAGESPGMFALLVPPEVLAGVRTALRARADSKILSELGIQLFRDFTAFVDSYNEDRFSGFGMIATPSLTFPASAGTATSFLMTPNALMTAVDEDQFWSDSPRSEGGVLGGPFFEWHQVFSYGRQLCDAEQLIKLQLPVVAASNDDVESSDDVDEPEAAKPKK